MVKLEGKFLPLYIHPSLCKSSNWNSSPSWETNAADITPVSSSVHGCNMMRWRLEWSRMASLIHYADNVGSRMQRGNRGPEEGG
jgi:hypothetical protein